MITSEVIMKVIDSPDYIVTVKMPLFSKARPRLTRAGRAYMPQVYRDAQWEMRKQIMGQWKQPPLEGPLAVHIEMHGEGRGDADNLMGAVLDAAGPSAKDQGILWVDDRVSIITYLSSEWHKAPKVESKWIIKITVL